ncbi:MAG: leucine--tRNA ligase [Bacteroidota bacterium]
MEYTPNSIEQKWQKHWEEHRTYQVENESDRPKYYVLDMFPYPSGAGLHVGHPLGYIASDIYSRYKRLKGFNVLHPMGFDAFGLPAEQYALATGIHPAVSTDKNIERYKEQMALLGFSFDWSREVKTCDPNYYKWTQWIFTQLFAHYYDQAANKALPIAYLVATFGKEGNGKIKAATTQTEQFSAEEWNAMNEKEQRDVLMNYRLAYREIGYVNWCEELGTVLANDQVKDGFSERGGYPVVQKAMPQWNLRITAYADRLLYDLETIDWSNALKSMQSNWIGRSTGAQMFFNVEGSDDQIEIYTTRPDTIFGATYMVLAPEHELVVKLTTPEQQKDIDDYLAYSQARSEIDRMSDKQVTGAFTGAYAINPFTGKKVPIWIAEYVLISYGTGAIMAVPSDDERDQRFAEKFGLEIIPVVDKSDYPGATLDDKVGKIINSEFLNGMEVKEAIVEMNKRVEEMGIGQSKVNYKLRDAGFSRQRYWGEPFPVVYDENGFANTLPLEELPLTLPETEDFQPGRGGKSPLSRLEDWVNLEHGHTRETDTMPAVAGSSWYYLRYMDSNNPDAFASSEAVNYWQDVDLYVGGAEHAVAHLMYARFWHKFLYDMGLVPTNEPFKKLVNQGMIQGRSNFVYRANEQFAERSFKEKLKEYEIDFQTEYPIAGGYVDFAMPEHKLAIEIKSGSDLKRYLDHRKADYDKEGWKLLVIPTQEVGKYYFNFDIIIKRINRAIEGIINNSHLEEEDTHPLFISYDMVKEKDLRSLTTALHVDVNIVHNDVLDMKAFQNWRPDYKNAYFVTNKEGKYICGHAVEKMSKSKYNVVNPDLMVEQYGADVFRMYEMFLGPIEASKPWDTLGISGVSKFMRRFWDLFFTNEQFAVSEDAPTKAELKVLHATIKKVSEDIERFSFNTCVSAFMEASNDLRKMKCNKRAVLEPLTILLAPFAPYATEELWHLLGNASSVHHATYPSYDESYLKEDEIEYPISINGKKRATAMFPSDASKEEIEKAALEVEAIQKWLEGKTVRKIIVVPKRMVNVVVG